MHRSKSRPASRVSKKSYLYSSSDEDNNYNQFGMLFVPSNLKSNIKAA